MERNNSGDEMFEIKPDILEDDSDMKISGSSENVEKAPQKPVDGSELGDTLIGYERPVNEHHVPEEKTEEVPEDSFENDFDEELVNNLLEGENEDEELFDVIGDSILKQAENDLEGNISDEESEEEDEPGFLSGIPWWAYSILALAIAVVGIAFWLNTSDVGKKVKAHFIAQFVSEKVDYQPVEGPDPVKEQNAPVNDQPVGQAVDEEELSVSKGKSETPEVKNNTDTQTSDVKKNEDQEPYDVQYLLPASKASLTLPDEMDTVYNILIVCEEGISNPGYVNADSIMVASVNTDKGTVSLTSILRDTYVYVPGREPMTLSKVYSEGGIALLYSVLREDLLLSCDNYISVSFDAFKAIIDALGGVEVKLTSKEAKYLNKTNYIADEAFRNVKKGVNLLNGEQALGYCRISKVATEGEEKGDLGRTSRQRNLLSGIYSSVTKLDMAELVAFLSECLPYFKTDMTAEKIEEYINLLYLIGKPDISTYRIPMNGSYSSEKAGDESVLVIDADKCAATLYKLIYGDELGR